MKMMSDNRNDGKVLLLKLSHDAKVLEKHLKSFRESVELLNKHIRRTKDYDLSEPAMEILNEELYSSILKTNYHIGRLRDLVFKSSTEKLKVPFTSIISYFVSLKNTVHGTKFSKYKIGRRY